MKKQQLIEDELRELVGEYPVPTEEQFEAAKHAVEIGELKLGERTIRMALLCSIHRETKKFDIERFWNVLPEFAAMEMRWGA